MSEIRRRTISGLKVGDSFAVSRSFTEEEVNRFADLSRDYNPVHFEQRFTATKGFNGLICHGLLVASLLTEIGGQIGWLASQMQLRFKGPVYVGETVTCHFTISEIDGRGRATADVVYTNPQGNIVLEAVLKGILPGSEEKSVLEAMVAEGDPTNKLHGG